MGAALIPLIAGGISGIASLVGGNATNQANAKQQAQQDAFNAQQAQLNRDYQTQMSNTQWQRGVADMKAAGLNPALAYQQGGASSPSGSTASSAGMIPRQNVMGTGISNGIASAQAAAQIQTQIAQRDQIKASTDYTNAQAGQIRTMLAAQLAKVQADTDLSSSSAARNRTETANVADSFSNRMALLQAQWEQTMASANQTRLQSTLMPGALELQRLSIPAARNLSNAANTLWGRYVTPYIGDAKSISQTLNPWMP